MSVTLRRCSCRCYIGPVSVSHRWHYLHCTFPPPRVCPVPPPCQVGMGNMDHYERDFEEVMLTETGGYYKRKAAEWINQDSCPDYMLKVRVLTCS